MEDKNILETMAVPKLFFKLSVPAVVGQLINMLYNIVDRIFIGRIPEVGALAITGMGVVMPLIMLVTAFSSLIGMGGAPLASIAMGEKNDEKAEKILGNAFTSLLLLAAVITIIFHAFQEKILYFFGASVNTIPYASAYASVYILGSVFVLVTLGLNMFISAQGFSMYSMATVTVGAVINIILDPILIFHFEMGIKGAAVATIIAQGISMIWVLHFLTGKKTRIRLKKEHFIPDLRLLLSITALGISPFIMQSTESLLNIVLNNSLLRYGGDLYVGAMSILATISQFLMLPLTGLVQGAQPIISYNYGAKKPERMQEGFKIAMITGMVYALLFYLLTMFKPGLFTGMFTTDSELLAAANWAIRIYMAAYILLPVQIICQQTFLALGQSKISLFLALLRKIVLLIPLIFILPRFLDNQVFAVFLAEPIADAVAAITTGIMFYRFFTDTIDKMKGDNHDTIRETGKE